MIGDDYKSAAIQAVIGPAHSSAIPDVLWGGWLNGSLTLLEMTGLTVSHDDFGPITDGVANTTDIDAGACPSTTPAYFGLFDAESSGNLVAYAAVTFSDTPTEDESLTFLTGELTFTYTEGS